MPDFSLRVLSMHLDSDNFSIHDIRRFPLVVFNQAAATVGYAGRWEQEIEALMQHGQRFVVVYDQLRTEESQADRKQRGMWLKQNKAALAGVCLSMISVEPEAERRAQAQAMGEMAVKAFGIAHVAVASLAEAQQLSERLLSAAG